MNSAPAAGRVGRKKAGKAGPAFALPIGRVTAGLAVSVRQLVARGERRIYRGGAILINEGERGDSLFVVLGGRLKVFSINGDGNEVTYGILERGDFFGEMSLDGGPRSASVQALENCECAVLPRSAVREHALANPEFALDLINIVIHRAREATRVARALALDSAYQRLVQFLDMHTKPPAKGAAPQLRHFTHQEIASRIGTARETVGRLLRDMEKAGSIHINRYTLTLLKPLSPGVPRQ